MSENKNYGSKRLVVGAHYGFRDWLSQRVTASLMAIFTLVLIVQVADPPIPTVTDCPFWVPPTQE